MLQDPSWRDADKQILDPPRLTSSSSLTCGCHVLCAAFTPGGMSSSMILLLCVVRSASPGTARHCDCGSSGCLGSHPAQAAQGERPKKDSGGKQWHGSPVEKGSCFEMSAFQVQRGVVYPQLQGKSTHTTFCFETWHVRSSDYLDYPFLSTYIYICYRTSIRRAPCSQGDNLHHVL